MGEISRISNENFITAYSQFVKKLPITCVRTGLAVEAGPTPTAVILDKYFYEAMKAVQDLSKRRVKVLAWNASAASYTLYPWAPQSFGGRGDLRPQILDEHARIDKPITEIAQAAVTRSNGTLVDVAGLPPMFDHEYYPQEMMTAEPIAGLLWMGLQNSFDICDGVITQTSEAYEPEALSAVRTWLNASNKTVHCIGPLIPLPDANVNFASGEAKQSKDAEELQAFMDKVLTIRGEQSLLFISFGSLFCPKHMDIVWAFLDVVMDRSIPFIFSYASPFSTIPDTVMAKIQRYGLGFTAKWSPQQTILSHRATGWFVSHCGQNSVMESITLGVPIICWPFFGDQPLNAAHLSVDLEVAYELIEVRTGSGLKPLHRTGKAPKGTVSAVREEAASVLERAFGEDGQKKRANMRKLQEDVLRSLSEGTSHSDMKALVISLL